MNDLFVLDYESDTEAYTVSSFVFRHDYAPYSWTMWYVYCVRGKSNDFKSCDFLDMPNALYTGVNSHQVCIDTVILLFIWML